VPGDQVAGDFAEPEKHKDTKGQEEKAHPGVARIGDNPGGGLVARALQVSNRRGSNHHQREKDNGELLPGAGRGEENPHAKPHESMHERIQAEKHDEKQAHVRSSILLRGTADSVSVQV
jgi:hypothetical protein